MANNRQANVGRRRQVVMGTDVPGVSGSAKLFVERYLTNKGKFLIVSAKTRKDKDAIWAKYGKNRYKPNPDTKPVRVIFHRQLHASEIF